MVICKNCIRSMMVRQRESRAWPDSHDLRQKYKILWDFLAETLYHFVHIDTKINVAQCGDNGRWQWPLKIFSIDITDGLMLGLTAALNRDHVCDLISKSGLERLANKREYYDFGKKT